MENCMDEEAPKSFLARHSDSRPLLRKERGIPCPVGVGEEQKQRLDPSARQVRPPAEGLLCCSSRPASFLGGHVLVGAELLV